MVYCKRHIAAFCTAAVLSSTAPMAFAHDPNVHEHHQEAATVNDIEKAYLAESDAAMEKMMEDMESKPVGDVDRDFVAMMLPHHQGAIDMAVAILKYGRNEQLKRIAQEIIVEQQQEINAMKMAVGDPLVPPAAAPTRPSGD